MRRPVSFLFVHWASVICLACFLISD
jgi:hypothetical protein